MPDTPTPGQVCYAAWRDKQRSSWLYEAPLPWRSLDWSTQQIWEAAAQAVRDHANFPPLDLRLEEPPPADEPLSPGA